MSSEDKTYCCFFICLAAVLCTLSASLAFFYASESTTAISAGLVQKAVPVDGRGNTTIVWTKP